MTGQIHLTAEKETLFITLSAKSLDYCSKHSILHDKEADDILKKIITVSGLQERVATIFSPLTALKANPAAEGLSAAKNPVSL